MTREELLERINDIRDELEELADDAESIDVEEKFVRNTAFKMSFADVKQLLTTCEISLFHVGDLIINQEQQHEPQRRTNGVHPKSICRTSKGSISYCFCLAFSAARSNAASSSERVFTISINALTLSESPSSSAGFSFSDLSSIRSDFSHPK